MSNCYFKHDTKVKVLEAYGMLSFCGNSLNNQNFVREQKKSLEAQLSTMFNTEGDFQDIRRIEHEMLTTGAGLDLKRHVVLYGIYSAYLHRFSENISNRDVSDFITNVRNALEDVKVHIVHIIRSQELSPQELVDLLIKLINDAIQATKIDTVRKL